MKKNKLILLLCLALTVSVFTGCKNLSSILGGGGDRPHTSVSKPDGDPAYNTIKFNVVTAQKLSEVEAEKEKADYDGYVNLKNVIKRVKDSVVHVIVKNGVEEKSATGVVIGVSQTESLPSDGSNSYQSSQSNSSAIMTDAETVSYIATCHHLIADATSVSVAFSDGSVVDAKFIGSDPDSDISVFSVKKALAPVEFYNDSDALEMGESVVAIGNPLQAGDGVAVSGILSSAPTELDFNGKNEKVLLTDATIGKDNSGGALFTQTGFFIGMINGKYNENYPEIERLDFAMPSDELINIAKQLVETSSDTGFGYVKGKYVLGYEVVDEYANRWGTQINVTISSLDQDGSFSASNLKVGDIIKTVTYKDETFVATNSKALVEFLNSQTFEIGDVLSFSITRDETSITVPVTVRQYVYEP